MGEFNIWHGGGQGARSERQGECKEYKRGAHRAGRNVCFESVLWSPSTGLNHIMFGNYSMVTHAGAHRGC